MKLLYRKLQCYRSNNLLSISCYLRVVVLHLLYTTIMGINNNRYENSLTVELLHTDEKCELTLADGQHNTHLRYLAHNC